MLRSVHSPWDAQDDLRSVRSYAPPHTRFSSISEFSDSPSVYSHAYFSPDSRDIEPNTSSYRYDVPDSSSQRRPSISNSDYLDDYAASSLDLDDEDVASVLINTLGDTENDDEDDDTSHRISVQGPKIRFHSRAPWETGEDNIDENDSDHSAMSNVFGKKVKSKTAKADLMRHFGKSSSARPSAESIRSQVQSNSSFEIVAGNQSGSRGALYTLAQESFSTSSLTVPSSQRVPALSLRNCHNFSLPRTTNYPPTTHYDDQMPEEPQSPTSSLQEMGHVSRSSSSTQDIPRPYSPASEVPRNHERCATVSSFHTSRCRVSHEDFVHPYANPDLVASYTPPRPTQLRSTFGHVSRSDSAVTVTDSLSSRSGAFSSTITPDTSASSIPSRDHISSTGMRVHGKDISPPIAVLHSSDLNSTQCDQSTNLPSFHPPPAFEGVPGWNAYPSSSVTLISLQEAQARERTRSATANAVVSSPSRAHETTSRIPFPDADDTASIASTETSATGNFKQARPRSTSAGARAKGVLHSVVAASFHNKPERRGSEPDTINSSGQTLKHKKSGFMRLFNGREREKGRDKGRSPPPPVPPLHGVYSDYPHAGNEDSKSSLPTILPRLSSLSSDARSSTALNESSSDAEGLSPKMSSPSLKRAPPSLYISTGASNRSPLCADHRLMDPAQSPQSGKKPPGHPQLEAIDFQALKLRPISTTFSSQFADIVAIPEVEHTPELELDTPTSTISSVAALSPVTPGWSRPSDDKSSPEEQSLVIKALREQMIAAKKAWQHQIWDLQGQVRNLQAEIEDLHAADEDKGYCEHCGRGGPRKEREASNAGAKKIGVVDRPRGRTGDSARFVSRN
ncbi:uncharacterized protein EDB93DRAFT_1111655 [Suillus bovinus]|uniref:uncharacterized protein n=1 Tax=Suillus bovinus TaxID=48563 RepID=UPI001B883568|nr:uncharacterized protein EDB93DRAFT_1111655 [Suillus bovinus]KAG2159720.1 hypothetical protein EDB93DRAFT_1111655 [Suillus bovinus]